MRRNSQTAAERLMEEYHPDLPTPLSRIPVREDYPDQQAFDDARASAALAAMAEIALSPLYRPAERRAAARIFLTYTKPKPAVRQGVTLNAGPVEFLAKLSEDVMTPVDTDEEMLLGSGNGEKENFDVEQSTGDQP